MAGKGSSPGRRSSNVVHAANGDVLNVCVFPKSFFAYSNHRGRRKNSSRPRGGGPPGQAIPGDGEPAGGEGRRSGTKDAP